MQWVVMALQDGSSLRRATEERAAAGLLKMFRKAGAYVVIDEEKTVSYFYLYFYSHRKPFILLSEHRWRGESGILFIKT